MLVNNVNITTFKAKLLKKDIQSADVIIYDDWLRAALQPLYFGKQETFKKLKLEFVIEDTDDEACLINISNLVKQLSKCTVKFDDLDFYYDCTISNVDHEQFVQTGYFLFNVELKSGYAYLAGVTETLNHVLTKNITVQGNLPTPAVVTVTVPVNTSTITITGFDTPIVIANLLANVPVVINGELCTVIQNGSNKFGETDFWSFPKLNPGANTIDVSSSNCVITVVYKPKFI